MKLFKWAAHFGRSGDLSGLFALDEGEQQCLEALCAREEVVQLGEVLGKHSWVEYRFKRADFRELELVAGVRTGVAVSELARSAGCTTICGTNPVNAMRAQLEQEIEGLEGGEQVEGLEGLRPGDSLTDDLFLAWCSR